MDYSSYMLNYPGKSPVCRGHLKYANHANYRPYPSSPSNAHANTVYVTSIADNRNNIPSVKDSSDRLAHYPICYPSDIPNTYMADKRRNHVTSYEMHLAGRPRVLSAMQTASYPTVPATADIWSDYDMDISYFTSIYPKEVKQLMLAIERELDQYDSEDSFLYDEYPDQATLYLIAQNIYNKLPDDMKTIEPDALETMQIGKNELPYPAFVRDWFFNTILLLIYADILSRRRNKAMGYFV
ncbi:MAG: hypothetical protein E7256_06905 [Lachnospiraceae bacterium]|nr:hypothetical protein [Lachnospiraceae bacterium]